MVKAARHLIEVMLRSMGVVHVHMCFIARRRIRAKSQYEHQQTYTNALVFLLPKSQFNYACDGTVVPFQFNLRSFGDSEKNHLSLKAITIRKLMQYLST